MKYFRRKSRLPQDPTLPRWRVRVIYGRTQTFTLRAKNKRSAMALVRARHPGSLPYSAERA